VEIVKKKKINIGAGDTKYDGFINCDVSNLFSPDYIFDLEKDKFPFKDNSVEEVLAFHVLEHLGEGYFHCLQELYRVCVNKAKIYIKVPHYRHHTFYDDPTHKRPITIRGMLLFDQEFNKNNPYSFSKLGLLYNVNFKIIENEDVLNRKHPMFSYFDNLPYDEKLNIPHLYLDAVQETRMILEVIKK
jgi:hypothetical protein